MLTLVNRSKEGAELTLTRKNSFQLWGRGSGNQRLNDTTFALRTLLRNAGLAQAEQELDQYLSQHPKRGGNRVSAREMLALLNTHLAKAESAPENATGVVGEAKQTMANAQGAIMDGTMSVLRDLMQPSGSDSEIPDIDDLEPSLAKRFQPGPVINNPPALKPLQYPGSELYPPKAEGRSLAELLQNAKVSMTDDKQGANPELGQGTFGIVKVIQMEGNPDSLVMKTFKADEATPLTLQRGLAGNEAMAAYLTSKKDPEYGKGLKVVQPEYFLVYSGDRFLMVDPLGLRALIKASPANQIKCHGLVMKRAPGEEVEKQARQLTLEQKKKIVKGTLEAIRQLNQRGFTHRDIKPANTFFDPRTNDVSLIDTGMLNKATKSDPSSRQMTGLAGSPGFMHPRVMTGKPYGTEADLYSATMMGLDLAYPSISKEIQQKFVVPVMQKIRKEESIAQVDRFFDKASMMKYLDQRISDAKVLNARKPGTVDEAGLKAFKAELDNPGSFASYLMDCIELATAEAPKRFVRSARGAAGAQGSGNPSANPVGVDWKDPAKANAAYERLISDPRVQV